MNRSLVTSRESRAKPPIADAIRPIRCERCSENIVVIRTSKELIPIVRILKAGRERYKKNLCGACQIALNNGEPMLKPGPKQLAFPAAPSIKIEKQVPAQADPRTQSAPQRPQVATASGERQSRPEASRSLPTQRKEVPTTSHVRGPEPFQPLSGHNNSGPANKTIFHVAGTVKAYQAKQINMPGKPVRNCFLITLVDGVELTSWHLSDGAQALYAQAVGQRCLIQAEQSGKKKKYLTLKCFERIGARKIPGLTGKARS